MAMTYDESTNPSNGWRIPDGAVVSRSLECGHTVPDDEVIDAQYPFDTIAWCDDCKEHRLVLAPQEEDGRCFWHERHDCPVCESDRGDGM